MNYLNQKLQRAMRGGDVSGMQEVASQAARFGSRDIMRQAERGLREYAKAQEKAQRELIRAQREQERQARQQARDAERAARQQASDYKGDAIAFFTEGSGASRRIVPITAPSGGVMKKWGNSGVLWDGDTGLPYAMDPKTRAMTPIDPDKDGKTVVKDGHVYKVVEGLPWKWVGFDPSKVGNDPTLAKELAAKTADAKREADQASDLASSTRRLISDNEKRIKALEKEQIRATGEERTRLEGEISKIKGENKGLAERLNLEQIDARKKQAYRQQVESENDSRLAANLAERQKMAYTGDMKGGLGLQSALNRISQAQQTAQRYGGDPIADLMGAITDRNMATVSNLGKDTLDMANAMTNAWNKNMGNRAMDKAEAMANQKAGNSFWDDLRALDAKSSIKLTGTNEKGKPTGMLADSRLSPEVKTKIQNFITKTGLTEIPRSWMTPEAQEARANAKQFGYFDVSLPKDFSLKNGAITTTRDEQSKLWGIPMPWTRKGEPINVGTYKFDNNGVPFIELNRENRLSPSQLSGNPFDGVKEYMPMPSDWTEQFKPRKPSDFSLSMLPADKRKEVMDNYKNELANYQQTAKDAWAGQKMDAERFNDVLTRWGVATPEQRQEMIAELDPSQAKLPVSERRLNTRALFEAGVMSTQEARLLEKSFYGTDPIMPSMEEAWDDWMKNSNSKNAVQLRKDLEAASTAERPRQLLGFFGKIENLNEKIAGPIGRFVDGLVTNAERTRQKADLIDAAKRNFIAEYKQENSRRVDYNPEAFLAMKEKLMDDKSFGTWAVQGGMNFMMQAVGPMAGMLSGSLQLGIDKLTGSKLLTDQERDLLTAQTQQSVANMDRAIQDRWGVASPLNMFNLSMALAAGGPKMAAQYFSGSVDSMLDGKTGSQINKLMDQIGRDIDLERMDQAKLDNYQARLTPLINSYAAMGQTANARSGELARGFASWLTGSDASVSYARQPYESSLTDPKSSMAQALAAYAQTSDNAYMDMARNAAFTSGSELALAKAVSDHASMDGRIAPTSWMSPLLTSYRSGMTAPLTEQGMEIIANIGAFATAGLTKYLATAGRAARAGSALNTASRAVASFDDMARAYAQAGIIQRAPGGALTFGQQAWNTSLQLAKQVPFSAGGEFLQEGISAFGQAGATFGDAFNQGIQGALFGVGMSAVHYPVGAAVTQIAQMRTDAALEKNLKTFVANYNKANNSGTPLTLETARIAQQLQSPELVRTLATQRKDLITRLTDVNESIREVSAPQIRPGALPSTPDPRRNALLQEKRQIEAELAANALDSLALGNTSVTAAQELQALPPAQRDIIGAAIRVANGVPITPEQESFLTNHTTASGKPAVNKFGDDFVLTDDFRAEIAQAAPQTAKTPAIRKTQAERDAELRAKYGGVFRVINGRPVFIADKKPAAPQQPAQPAGSTPAPIRIDTSNMVPPSNMANQQPTNRENPQNSQIVGSTPTQPAPSPNVPAANTPTAPQTPTQPVASVTAPPTNATAKQVDNAFSIAQNQVADWDRSNRNQQTSTWFDEGMANQQVNEAFSRAANQGGQNLATHGMAKVGTLTKGLKDLLALLANNIDPNRGGGRLYTAPLAVDNSQAGFAGGTASGTSYRDGPFILVQNQEASARGEGITNMADVSAILVNDANIAQLAAITEAIRAIRPDIIVAPYSQADQVVAQLATNTATAPTAPVSQSFTAEDGAQVTGTFEKQPDGNWQQTSPEAPIFTITPENTQFFQTLEDKAAYALNPQTPDAVQPGEFGQEGYTATTPAGSATDTTSESVTTTLDPTADTTPPPLPETETADVFTQPVNRGTALLMLQTAAPWVSSAPLVVRSPRFFTRGNRVVDAKTYAELPKQERARYTPSPSPMFAHQGKVYIDETALVEYLGGVAPEARQEKLKAALREEVIHVATMNVRKRAEVIQDWQTLPDTAKQRVVETYFTAELEAVGGDWTQVEVDEFQAGAEFWRMYLNAVTEGRTTEQVDMASEVASLAESDPSFAQRIKEALQDIARWLREELLGQLDPDTRAEFEQTAAKIDAEVAKLDAMLGITPQPATPAAEAASPMEAPVEQANAPPVSAVEPAETIDTPAAPLTRLPEKAAPRNQAFVPKPARGAQKWTQEALNTSLTSAAGSFGYKIVDTGIPSQYTAYGETLNYGTALYDKLNPGNEIGKWIDAMNADTNPAGNAIIQAASEPGLHRVWYGHDFFTNVDNVAAEFGWSEVPSYIIQLFKDSLTRSGLPLPGVELLVQSGAVSDRVATDWLSTNIGEVFGGGLSFLGTYKLYRAAKSGRLSKPQVIFATVGIGLKVVSGVMTAQPFLILSGLADTAILVTNLDQVKAAFKKGIEEFNKKPQAVRDLFERVAPPTAVAPVSQESSIPQDGREVKLPGSYPGDAGSTPAPATTLPVQPVQSVEATPPPLPPEDVVTPEQEVVTDEAAPPPLPPEPTEPAAAPTIKMAQAAKILGVTPKELLRLVKAAAIPAEKRGNNYLFTQEALDAYAAERAAKQAPVLDKLAAVAGNTATEEDVADLRQRGMVDIYRGQRVINQKGYDLMAKAGIAPRLTRNERVEEIDAQLGPVEKPASDIPLHPRVTKSGRLYLVRGPQGGTPAQIPITDDAQARTEANRVAAEFDAKEAELEARAAEMEQEADPAAEDEGMPELSDKDAKLVPKFYQLFVSQMRDFREARERGESTPESLDRLVTQAVAVAKRLGMANLHPGTLLMNMSRLPEGPLLRSQAAFIDAVHDVLQDGTRDIAPADLTLKAGIASPAGFTNRDSAPLSWAQMIQLGALKATPRPDGSLRVRMGKTPEQMKTDAEQAELEAMQREYLDDLRAEAGNLDKAMEDASASGFELLDAIQMAGGLPSPTSESAESHRGELTTLFESAKAMGKGAYGGKGIFVSRIFRKNAPDLDRLAQSLRGHGFDTFTPSDVLDLVDARFTENRPMYGTTTDFDDGMGERAVAAKPRVRLANASVTTEAGPIFLKKAHHGTPHKVDRFSLEKIGTGEGAQAFGWGLYFAENQGVAVDYQRTLAKRAGATDAWFLRPIDSATKKYREAINYADAAPMSISQTISALNASEADAPRIARELAAAARKPEYIKAYNDIADMIEAGEVVVSIPTGNLYTVELDVDDADLLDWDAPLSKQSPKVRAALKAVQTDHWLWKEAMAGKGGEQGGASLYKTLTATWPDAEFTRDGIDPKKKASDALLAAGISGIRYLDAGSRKNNASIFKDGDKWAVTYNNPAAGMAVQTDRFPSETEARAFLNSLPESYNFVIFDENLIRIVAENGEPVGNAEVVKNLMADSAAAGMLEEDGIPGALPLDAAGGLAESGARPGAQPAQGAAPAVAVDARQGELGIPAEDAFAGIAYRPARIWGLQALAERFLALRNSVGGQPIQPPIFRRDFGTRQAAFREAAQTAESLYRETLANVDTAYADRPGTADQLLPRLPEVRALFTDANGEMQLLGSRPVELEAGEPLFAKPRRTAPHQLDLFSDNYNQTATPWTPSWQAKEPAKAEAEADAPALSLEAQTESSGRIEDFGEKLQGARKDLWQRYTDMVMAELPADARDITLAKYLPEPDYEAMIASGMEPARVAAVKALRDVIPRKPSSGYKLAIWTKMVRDLRPLIQRLIDPANPIPLDKFQLAIADSREIRDTVRFYEDLGWPHFTQAKGWKLKQSEGYIRWNGELLPKSTVVSYMEQDFRASTELSSVNPPGDWRQGYAAVIQKFRDYLDAQAAQAKEPKKIDFQIYSDTQTRDVFIGKKGVSGVIRLQTGFASAKEARNWLADHYNELALKWEGMRQEPVLRRATNEPRTGPQRREGDVTPEMFSEAFGFRGVQFGNYVEGDRRQRDLNNAFDAFMDLSEALGIPAKALSFDGSLGLAFGARGRGGKRPAAAHYEPGEVVINLTKNAGPGSLAHEWFHALDNYFARLERTGSTKPKDLDEWATRAMALPKNVRPEVMEAFRAIRNSLGGDLDKRSRALDSTRSAPYYSQTIEKAARAFETYVIDRLGKSSVSNDYLANIDPTSEAYPRPNEMDGGIRQAFDTLFTTLDTRQGERGTMLFAKPRRSAPSSSLPGNYPDTLDIVIRSTKVAKLRLAGLKEGEATVPLDPTPAQPGRQPDLTPVSPLYKAAKHGGDPSAALEISEMFVNQKMVDELQSRLDSERPVILVPVRHADPGLFHNALPAALATSLKARIPNSTVDTGIVKVGGMSNTSVSTAQRMGNIQAFDGGVDTDAQYVVVDDVFTSGNTLTALIDHIVRAGGEVVAATAIADSQSQNYLKPRLQDVAKLLDRAGLTSETFKRDIGFPIEALTGSEIYRIANLERNWRGPAFIKERFRNRVGVFAQRSRLDAERTGQADGQAALFAKPTRSRGDLIPNLNALPEGVTAFSGAGLVEIGLQGIVQPTFAVEYNPAIAQAYRAAWGDHVQVADIRSVSMEAHKGKFHYHASPVCKNSSLLKSAAKGGGEKDLDIESARAVALHIRQIEPEVVTIENVPDYRKTTAAQIIRDALEEQGYTFDEGVYNAADYGAPTARRRYLLRAVKGPALLPEPAPVRGPGWWETVKDIIEDLPDDSIERAGYIQRSLPEQGIDLDDIQEPLLVSGTTLFKKVAFARPTQPAFTFKATPATVDRILLPDGRVKRVTAKAKARMTGVPDSFPLPEDEKVALTIIGNGVPPALVRNVFGPVIEYARARQQQLPLFAKARPMRDTTAELFGDETPFNLVGETLPPSAPAQPDIVVDAQAREQAFRKSGREDVGDLFGEPATEIPSPAMSGRRSEGAAAPSAISPAATEFGFTREIDAPIEKLKKDMVRFASGMSGLSDLGTSTYVRGGMQNYGVGFDVGLLSKNAIDLLANAVVNLDTQVFIDSGAFSHFIKSQKAAEKGITLKPLSFDKIFEKYDSILEAIQKENAVEADYPRPLVVMPDIIGNQKASLLLTEKYKDRIAVETAMQAYTPIIPIPLGELSLSQAYNKILEILNSNSKGVEIDPSQFIVGIPSNAQAVSREKLAEFLKKSKPPRIHFLGAAADVNINPLLAVVAKNAPDTLVTADASKVRSEILNGVAAGKTREQAITDALFQEDDPSAALESFNQEVLSIENALPEQMAIPAVAETTAEQSLFTEPVTEQGTLFDISPVGPRTWTQAEAARTITKQKAAEILKGSNLEGRNISTYEQAVAANNAHMGTLASEWSAVPIEEVVFENGESIPKYDAAATRDYRAASTLYPGDSNYPACQWCGKQPVRQLFQIKHDGKKLTLLAGSECITHFEEASGDRMLQDAKTKKNLADITAIRDARRELRNEFFESRTDSYGRTQSVWKNYDAEQIYNKLNTGNIDTDSGAAALTRWAKTKGPSAIQAMQEFSAFMADPKTIQQRIKRREALLRSMAYQLEPQYAEKFLPDYQVESLKRQKEKLESEIAELSGSMPLFAKPSRDVTRRNTAVQQAAQDYFDRKISQEEYLAIVRAEMPYMPMAEVPIPATAAEMDVISEDKKPKLFKASETLRAGDKVGLRLDIPAYRDHGVWIVSVHQPGTKSGAGTPIGYEPVARIRNATFESNPKAALNIARGTANKSTIARMEGEWVTSTPEEARQLAESAMNDPQWVQVGMNPFRHSWFYNRATGVPVVSAEDVVQVGGLVLAKNPVYTTPFDERFDAGGGVLFAKPRRADWPAMLERANDISVQEFATLASDGKLNEATGEPNPMEAGTGTTPISIGAAAGYPLEDIAHFYIARQLPEKFRDRADAARLVSRVIRSAKDAAESNTILRAFDRFAADAATEAQAEALFAKPRTGLTAPNGQPSNLTAEDHALVRTPEFKAWAGEWEIAAYVPIRFATNFQEARAAANSFKSEPITNIQTGLKAVVSRNTLDKMLNLKAVGKSESPKLHSLAVANLDNLFARATHGWKKPDKNNNANIAAVHRFFSPMRVGDIVLVAKITVFETAQENQNNPLYSVEAIEFDQKRTPAAQWVDATIRSDEIDPTSIRSAEAIKTLAQTASDFNPKSIKIQTDANSEPLASEVARFRQETAAESDQAPLAAKPRRTPPPLPPMEKRIEASLDSIENWNNVLRAAEEKPAGSVRKVAGEIREAMPYELWRGYQNLFRGRLDVADALAPGVKNILQAAQQEEALAQIGVNAVVDGLRRELQKAFGDPAFWSKNRTRLKEATRLLLPTASYLQPQRTGVDGGFEWREFERRSGTISQVEARKLRLRDGEWFQYDGRTYRLGDFLPDEKAFVLLEPISVEMQQAIYEEFWQNFPEALPILDRWITPDLKDAYTVGLGSTMSVEFNREALLSFMNEWPQDLKDAFGDLLPEVPRVEGYTPDIAAQRSIIATIARLLGIYKSPGRRFKTGALREAGNVKNLVDGFSTRAMEAHREKIRMRMREGIIEKAVVLRDDVPAENIGDYVALEDVFSSIVKAVEAARLLDKKAYPHLSKGLNPKDQVQLMKLVGDAARLNGIEQMVHKNVYRELMLSMARAQTEGILLRTLNFFLRGAKLGKLAAGSVGINWIGNQILTLTQAMNRMFAGITHLMVLDSKGAAVNTMEALFLLRGLITDRAPNTLNQSRIGDLIPRELFDNTTALSSLDAGTDYGNMVDDIKRNGILRGPAQGLVNAFKQGGISASILYAVHYSGGDAAVKQQSAYAAYRARAEVAANEAKVKSGRSEWMRNWIQKQVRENTAIHREVMDAARLYFMDYANVPAWMDPSASLPEEKGKKFLKEHGLWFIKWPYNFVRFMKRMGLDGAIETFSPSSTKQERARGLANMLTLAAIAYGGAALLSGDDEEDPIIGSRFDAEGKAKDRDQDTSSRMNLSALGRKTQLGRMVATALRMAGVNINDDLTNHRGDDYWMYYQNMTWMKEGLLMGRAVRGDMPGFLRDAGAYISDLTALGILSRMVGIAKVGSIDAKKSPVNLASEAFFEALSSPINPSALTEYINNMTDPVVRRTTSNKSLDFTMGPLESIMAKVPGLRKNLPVAGDPITPARLTLNFDRAGYMAREAKKIRANEKLTTAEKDAALANLSAQVATPVSSSGAPIDLRELLFGMGVNPAKVSDAGQTTRNIAGDLARLQAMGAGPESVRVYDEKLPSGETRTYITYPDPDNVAVRDPFLSLFKIATGVNIRPFPKPKSLRQQPSTLTPELMFNQPQANLTLPRQ